MKPYSTRYQLTVLNMDKPQLCPMFNSTARAHRPTMNHLSLSTQPVKSVLEYNCQANASNYCVKTKRISETSPTAHVEALLATSDLPCLTQTRITFVSPMLRNCKILFKIGQSYAVETQ